MQRKMVKTKILIKHVTEFCVKANTIRTGRCLVASFQLFPYKSHVRFLEVTYLSFTTEDVFIFSFTEKRKRVRFISEKGKGKNDRILSFLSEK